MDSDEITERPDLLQGQLLDPERGSDFWRNDGVIADSLVRSERKEDASLPSASLLSVTAAFARSGHHAKPN